MALHTIRTTLRPDVEITVDEAEYQNLLELGLVYDGTPPDPVADPFDARVAERLADAGSATRAAIDGLITDAQDPHVAALVEDPQSETRAALGAALDAKSRIDLRDWTDFDNTGSHDNRSVLAAAATQSESLPGATIFVPRGTTVIDVSTAGPVVFNGGTFTGDPDTGGKWGTGRGGVTLAGEGKRASTIKSVGAAAAIQWGSTQTKLAMGLRDLALIGPGKAASGSVGLDSRTTGGSYTYENALIEGFDIGLREHDNTLVTAYQLDIRHCNIGAALGYFSDAHTFTASRFDYCGIGAHIGYFDPSQGESTRTESHGITFLSSMFNLCDVGAFVEGAATEAIKFLTCYFEQWADVAIRLAPADLSSALAAAVQIDSYFNGIRQIEAPTGEKNHAIEVNRAFAVTIGGGGYRNHAVAPINVRSTEAKVEVLPGRFDRTSGEAGDVKLPDGSFINVGTNRKITVGQFSSRTVNRAAALPTASADWDGAELNVGGVLYRCGSDGAGGYAWYAQPTAQRASQLIAVNPILVPASAFMVVAGTAAETSIGGGGRWAEVTLADAALTSLAAPMQIPSGWAAVHVDMLHTRNSGTSGGVVLVNADLYQAATGDDISAGGPVGTAGPTYTPPTAGQLGSVRLLSSVAVDPTKLWSLRVRRDGANAGDTCSDAVQFLGVRVLKAA